MENLDLKEALSSIFQKDWWMKYLGLWGVYLIPIIGIFIGLALIGIGAISKVTPFFIIMCIIGGCVILAAILGSILINFFISGYFMLYGHDRALNKNAPYRPVFSKETFKESVIAGAKSLVAWFVMIPFFILMIPIITIGFFVSGASEIGLYISYTICFFIFGIPMIKILSYFLKDMNVISLFHWGEAFEYSKGVKSAVWVAIMPILASIVLSVIYTMLISHLNKAMVFVLQITLVQFFTFIFYAFYFNLLGQYTYAAIRQKEGVDPETLPQKNINNEGVVIIVFIAVGVLLSLMILGIVAALTIPSLVNRQSDLAAKVRIKKSISNYESAAEIYMIENSTPQKQVKDLKNFAGKNCENLGNYFKIAKKYEDCAFTTIDGVYWLFDPEDGSVNISDSYEKPTYNITLGVCQDGSVNCADEFPDVGEFLRK